MNMCLIRRRLNIVIVATLAVLLSGCAGQQSRKVSSVVDYLYPEGTKDTVTPTIPTLNLPIKVGIAFVPAQSTRSGGINLWSGVVESGSLTEVDKSSLLESVAGHFRKYQFISEIEIIPSVYLSPGGGFENLDQIRTMYGIDVIALVSYDQVQFTDEGFLSLTYWTLVGAYMVSGEKNDTSTMLDTVVYDIPSRKMLFRAPGTSNIKGRATPVNLSEELREDSIKGFNEAAEKMALNLDVQLSVFREKIKTNPEKARIVHREGYSGGGGAFGMLEGLLLLTFTVAFRAGKLGHGCIERKRAV